MHLSVALYTGAAVTGTQMQETAGQKAVPC